MSSSQPEPHRVKCELLADIELESVDLAGITPGLEAAIDAVLAESALGPQGQQRALAQLRNNLQRLAAVKADRKRFPEIAEVEIHRPVFILGLPRCGTSMLHALMGSDSRIRTPLMWEVAAPSPPPDATSFDTDPRAAAFDRYVDETFVGDWAGMRKAHPIGARIPEECGMILETAFCSVNPVMMFRMPRFYQWYLQADTSYGYQVHRQWLQHLGWRNPRPQWVLKVQEHMYHLPELLSVYPDAVFVQPHRDPRTVLASISELIRVLRSVSFQQLDLLELGREMLYLWHDGQRRMMDYRRDHPNLPVYDLSFKSLVADPVSAVRGIYDHYGLEFTDATAAGIRQWLADNPADKHGRHSYRMEDFGLSETQIQDTYGDYIETYREFI